MNGDEESAPASDQVVAEAQRKRVCVIDTALKRILRDDIYGYASNSYLLVLFTWIVIYALTVHLSLDVIKSQISAIALGIAVYLISSRLQNQYLSRLRNTLPGLLSENCLIQRMQHGLNGFPMIHDYAPRFWRFCYGRRPTTDTEWTWLISDNLEWYLHPPRKLRFNEVPHSGRIFLLSGSALIILIPFILLFCLGDGFAVFSHNIIMFLRNTLEVIAAVFVIALGWKSPLLKLHAQILLTALANYQAEAQLLIPPPGASAPRAAPPDPPG
jgi:hypothetical protein